MKTGQLLEEKKPFALSKSGQKKVKQMEREYDVRYMASYEVVWYLVVRHKFGLLATFTVVYVSFSLFGSLIVSLAQAIL